MGQVRLRVNPKKTGPAPRVHYAHDWGVSETSPQLKDHNLSTTAVRVNFLVVDPSGQYQTGDIVTRSNELVLRFNLTDNGGKRSVPLLAAPMGNIRYTLTLDGSEPREDLLLTRLSIDW